MKYCHRHRCLEYYLVRSAVGHNTSLSQVIVSRPRSQYSGLFVVCHARRKTKHFIHFLSFCLTYRQPTHLITSVSSEALLVSRWFMITITLIAEALRLQPVSNSIRSGPSVYNLKQKI